MERPPLTPDIPRPWAIWITNLWTLADSLGSHGTTAQRPLVGLFVGRCFFDTTLGKPVWLESVRPSVWVDATGTPV